jgi:hypothetical protein
MTPEEKLLVLASYADLTRAESDEARRLAPGLDWDSFADLAELNATVPLVRATLAKLGVSVPSHVTARFAAIADKVTAANTARLRIGKELLSRLHAKKIPVVILKGVLFAETLYRDPNYKKMNDIDILIRKEDLDAIYQVYGELGFFSAAELFGKEGKKQEKFSHHSPPYFSRDLACMIGTHWGLITPLAPYKLDYDAIWARVVDITLAGVPAKAMAPEDNLHHLCVHLPYYKTGVRELADIYNLLRAQKIDWALFLGEVRKAKTENLVFHALSLVQALSPRDEVAGVLEALRSSVSFYYARDAARKTRRAGLLLRSRSVHMSRIEKAYADFTATKHAGEKRKAFARIIGNILAPPVEDVVKMSALDAPSPAQLLVGRLAAPWRISRVFVRDLGAGIYAAMLAKATVDTAVDSVKQAFTGPPANDGYAAYAERLGLSVEALGKLKDALE